jgi:predicted type IV restriction endonuclease
MTKIPSKVQSRLTAGIKKFQPILADAKQRAVNESDTVIIIIDMLSEVFGYDKFTEITSEKEIRGTYCDLATVIDKKVQTLIEAKSINQQLKDNHVIQAVAYATNEGIDWVLLTTGAIWKVYKVLFTKPIDHQLILEIDFLALNHHEQADLEKLFLLTKESWPKSALSDYCEQKEALSKYSIAAAILSDTVLSAIRHELRQISPDVAIDAEQIRTVLQQEVLIADVLNGEKSDEAKKLIAKAASKEHKIKADRELAEQNTTLLQKVTVPPQAPVPAPLPITPPIAPPQPSV